MELLSFVWPFVSYKVREVFKKIFNENVSVRTNLGPVTGLKVQSTYGYEYIEFRGVPYGKPPIGFLRFKDPESAEPWTQPLLTLYDARSCHRDPVNHFMIGSEDCLRLNIYTKNIKPPKLFPVMVFLPGGAFTYGSGSKDLYSPEYLLQKDVILVVVNYRLGAFGFLSINDPEIGIPGNAGLKDQVLALKWVNQNIQHFGGDLNNITLFGESAGGCSVYYHMISDMSKGLFHKACAMSGTALNAWALGRIDNLAERMAQALGWDGTGGYKKIINILRTASPKGLIKAQDHLINKDELKRLILFSFGPVVEPYQSAQCFIPMQPDQMDKDRWSNHIPLMIGGCANEGLYLYKRMKKDQQFLIELNKCCEYIIPSSMEVDVRSSRCKELGNKLKQYYFGNENISFARIDTYLQMLGDLWFWHGIYRTVKSRMSEANMAETYLYRFAFDSQIQSHLKVLFAGKGISGACHGDDLSYVFKNAVTVSVSENSREFRTVQKMVELWTSFAITGKPVSDSANCHYWTPVENGKPLKCLNISDNVEFIELPELPRMLFLDTL